MSRSEPTPCKVDDCGWTSAGTSSGATPCIGMNRPACLFSLVCERAGDDGFDDVLAEYSAGTVG